MTETSVTARQPLDVQAARKALQMIAADMADDARTFDGKPFDGCTVGEYFGNHGAAIAALPVIVETLLPSEATS